MTLLGAFLNLVIVFGPPLLVRRDVLARGDPVVILLATMITLFYLAELPRRHLEGTRHSKMDVSGNWLAASSCAALLGIFWISLSDYLGAASVAGTSRMFLAGAVMLGGIVLRHTAIRTLSHGFVTQPTPVPGRPLMVRGIYAWVRHPSETGLMVLVYGAVGLLGSDWGAVATLAVLVPLTLARLHIEEQALLAAFGGQYASYQRTVSRFIPSVF